MDVLNTDKKSKHASPKIAKFILILIGIATIQWISATSTSLSSISSFIQNSGKVSKLARIFERAPPRLDESAETSVSTILLIHYHKTGNNFIVDLLTEIDKTYQQQRHDLAMKDPFILNREFKKAEEQRRSQVETSSGIPEMDKRRRLSDHEPQKARSKKQNKLKDAGDESIKIQTKKANGNQISATGEEQDVPIPSNKLQRHMKNRNRGEEAKKQDEARKANSKEMPQKRAHDSSTGCPKMGDLELEIGAAYRLTAPDLFCKLSVPVKMNMTIVDETQSLDRHDGEAEVDLELDGMKKATAINPERLPFPAWETTKIVHFVRDPLDMALSNYLYHSQYPTPESWVLARHLNPCAPNEDLVNYTLAEFYSGHGRDPSFPKVTISMDDLQRVFDLCRYYRKHHPMGGYKPNMTKAFYKLLRRLPPYDGLRVATAQFLLAHNPQSGGDLLRMSNNILRLREWEADGLVGRSESKQQSHILTVSMGKIVKDMTGSIQEICNFIFGHISNYTMRTELAQDIADSMLAMYAEKEQASAELRMENAKRGDVEDKGKSPVIDKTVSNLTMKLGSHVTQGLIDGDDRESLKRQLQEDPILGSIMLQLREIVRSAGIEV